MAQARRHGAPRERRANGGDHGPADQYPGWRRRGRVRPGRGVPERALCRGLRVPPKVAPRVRGGAMCRNIRTLYNFAPPATEDEVRASSVQFVRKLSGFTRPSKANQPAFDRAVEQVTRAAQELLDSLVTSAPPRDRDVEASKARARARDRYQAPRGGREAAQG